MIDYYVHPSSFIDKGAKIGEKSKIWHFSHIMKNSKIGKNCNIGQNVVISPDVIIGNNVKIQNNVSVYTGVVCEDDVFLGPSCVFTNVINPRSQVNRRNNYSKTILRKGCTIGANSTIICGLELGSFSFIGAGSVITKDIGPYELIVGNPGKRIGYMSEFGNRLIFNKENIAKCNESGERYLLKNNKVVKL
tara:strand:+ start:1076 stop:1648 length:573 start_codon:yes stop_codon:yes gene_type:complete